MTLQSIPISTRTTAQYLQQLAQLYQLGHASPVVDRALAKLLKYEAEICRAQLRVARGFGRI